MYIDAQDLKNGKVLNDTVLVKILKTTNEYVTASGIYLSGVEHDFLVAEVVLTNPEWYDKDGVRHTNELVPGDKVVLEKNFSNKYGLDYRERDGSLKRDRIDHFVKVGEDDEYRYSLVTYDDIYMKEVPEGTEGSMTNGEDIKGTLYSIMTAKKVTRSPAF